jgi:hypothetical protein
MPYAASPRAVTDAPIPNDKAVELANDQIAQPTDNRIDSEMKKM